MARQKQTSKGGGAFYGVLIGLIGGLAVAAAVAYYVMSSPMPFVDKATRDEPAARPDPRSAPDPNRGLAGGAADTAGTAATTSGTTTSVPPVKPKDELGALIATLPVEPGKSVPPLPAAPKPPPVQPVKPVEDGRAYYLQVGAFRVVGDAEAMQARMVLMGLPVQIQRADVNGVLLNRVRVGPFSRLDDMNKARAQLSQEKIDSNVVRQ